MCGVENIQFQQDPCRLNEMASQLAHVVLLFLSDAIFARWCLLQLFERQQCILERQFLGHEESEKGKGRVEQIRQCVNQASVGGRNKEVGFPLRVHKQQEFEWVCLVKCVQRSCLFVCLSRLYPCPN